MTTHAFVPRWARELLSLHMDETLSTERLAILLFNNRPPGAGADNDSCLDWANALMKELANSTATPAETTDARVRRELREKYAREARWPDGGVLNPGC